MPQINQLPTRTPTAGDLVAFFSSANGDAAKTSFTAIATLMTNLMGVSGGGGFITQYSSPTATAFTVTVGGVGQSTWLIITPTTTGFSGTITLPDMVTVADQQELIVVTTNTVSLSYVATGMTVFGAPPILLAGGSFRLKYDAPTKFWYCISLYPQRNPVTELVSVGGILTVDCSKGDYFTVVLFENIDNIVYINPDGVGFGMTKTIEFTQDDAIAYTVDMPASFTWVGGIIGVISATLGAVDVLITTSFDNGTAWRATLGNEWS